MSNELLKELVESLKTARDEIDFLLSKIGEKNRKPHLKGYDSLIKKAEKTLKA